MLTSSYWSSSTNTSKTTHEIMHETEANKHDATRVLRAACIIDGAYIQKVSTIALCKFSDLDRGQVFLIFCIMLMKSYLQSRLQRKCSAASELFFSCVSSSPQFLPLSQLSHPPPTPCSQSIPHFWSIFYALLHYSQLPFTVHYLLPSLTNILSTSLSFL